MKKITFALVVIFASLSVIAQNKEQDAKDFYEKYYMRVLYYIGSPKFEIVADSISDILDSIGVVRYREAFKQKEQTFQKDFCKLLSFDHSNTDSTDIYLSRLGGFDYTNHYNYYFLKLHSKELLPYCFDFNNEYQRYMLLFLEPSQAIKDSLLNNFKWYDWQRARLGDTIAENREIEDFLNVLKNLKNSNDLQKLTRYGHFLLRIGTEKSLKTYLSALDCNKIYEFDDFRDGLFFSAFSCLIAFRGSFFDYYPQYCLLSEAYMRAHMDEDANRGDLYYRHVTDYERRYINQLEEFCLKEFGIELHINIPFFEMNNYGWLEEAKAKALLDKYQ